MTETTAQAIAAWTYPAPYTLYNHTPEQRSAVVEAMLEPTLRFSAITDKAGELVGFCCLGTNAQVSGGDYARPATDVGMGMRPDLTGQGNGSVLVDAVINHASSVERGRPLRVTVAAFNARARSVWEKAGFREDCSFTRASDGLEFLVMTAGF